MRLRRRSGGTSGDDRSAADRGITYRAAMGDGAQAVGARAVGRARIRRLEIDELIVRRLRILAQLQAQSREFALTAYPEFTEKLLWGGKVVGVRISLPKAKPAVVKSLVVQACEYKSKMLPARKAKQPAVFARKPKVRPD